MSKSLFWLGKQHMDSHQYSEGAKNISIQLDSLLWLTIIPPPSPEFLIGTGEKWTVNILPLLKMTPLMGEKVPASSFLLFFSPLLQTANLELSGIPRERFHAKIAIWMWAYHVLRERVWRNYVNNLTTKRVTSEASPRREVWHGECGGLHGAVLGSGSNSCHRCPTWVTGGKLRRGKRWGTRQYSHATICQSNEKTSVGGRAWIQTRHHRFLLTTFRTTRLSDIRTGHHSLAEGTDCIATPGKHVTEVPRHSAAKERSTAFLNDQAVEKTCWLHRQTNVFCPSQYGRFNLKQTHQKISGCPDRLRSPQASEEQIKKEQTDRQTNSNSFGVVHNCNIWWRNDLQRDSIKDSLESFTHWYSLLLVWLILIGRIRLGLVSTADRTQRGGSDVYVWKTPTMSSKYW